MLAPSTDQVPSPINVVVIGDSSVGKTALILAACTERFMSHPVPLHPSTPLPEKLLVMEGIRVMLHDSQLRPGTDPGPWEETVRQAHAIVVTFAVNQTETLNHVGEVWMPRLQQLGVTVPVILAGLKCDILREEDHLHQVVAPLMDQWPQVESCLECSAKTLQFVQDVFFYAVKAVLHPQAPLMDIAQGRLQPLCIKALKRVFIMSDKNQDGILDDAELNSFQMRCFNAPLQPEELRRVKQVVSEKLAGGVSNDGLTLQGFLFLHALFIERGRLETVWTVLREYGYSNKLLLLPAPLEAVNFSHGPSQDVMAEVGAALVKAGQRPAGMLPLTSCWADALQTFELTPVALDFLLQRFALCTGGLDKELQEDDLEGVFSVSPSNPWAQPPYQHVLVQRGRHKGLTLTGYLSLWALMAQQDPQATLAHLMYLGQEAEAAAVQQMVRITRPPRKDWAGQHREAPCRRTFKVLVFGTTPQVRQAVLHGLLKQSPQAAAAPPPRAARQMPMLAGMGRPSAAEDGDLAAGLVPLGQLASQDSQPHAAARKSSMLPDGGAFLLMQEVTAARADILVQPAETPEQQERQGALIAQLHTSDLAVMAFDSDKKAREFERLVHLTSQVAAAAEGSLPVLFVSSSAQLEKDVADACSDAMVSLCLPGPLSLGGSPAEVTAVYQQIVLAALQPHRHNPMTPKLKAARQQKELLASCVKWGGAGVLLCVGLYALWAAGCAEEGGSDPEKPDGNRDMASQIRHHIRSAGRGFVHMTQTVPHAIESHTRAVLTAFTREPAPSPASGNAWRGW